MNLFGICLITEDVKRLSAFYQKVLQAEAEDSDIHVTLQTDGCGLAIYDRRAAETVESASDTIYSPIFQSFCSEILVEVYCRISSMAKNLSLR